MGDNGEVFFRIPPVLMGFGNGGQNGNPLAQEWLPCVMEVL
jgi:hypothetical protein